MTLNDSMLVAIDGPAGSGKSSVSKQVAVELGSLGFIIFTYIWSLLS